MKTASLLLLLTGCVAEVAEEEEGVTEALRDVHQYDVSPSATDDWRKVGDECRFVFGNMCPPDGIGCRDDVFATDSPHRLYTSPRSRPVRLLVFLNGANGKPTSNTSRPFLETAVALGHHVIALDYYDGGVNHCRGDVDCYGALMDEVITGRNCPDEEDGDPCFVAQDVGLDVRRVDSIEHRLIEALEWADCHHPDDGWGHFYRDHEVRWGRVALAGFSQGAGYAANLALRHPAVQRVVLFSSPDDGAENEDGTWVPATWIQRARSTANRRFYGLVHHRNKENLDDPMIANHLHATVDAWRALGMFGSWRFDPSPFHVSDFDGKHILISIDRATSVGNAHTSVIRDRYVPFGDDSDPEDHCDFSEAPESCEFLSATEERIGYEQAWRHMLGRP